ncbi:MAG: hypothetical protein R2762_12380 [Bryobacteraceae bacterium]
MIVHAKPHPILGLFPALDCLGGVEASGRAASEVLRQLGWRQRAHVRLHLHETRLCAGQARCGGRTLRSRGPARFVLVWHLGLLKLVPFLVRRGAPVALFLHGVEAWRRHDRITMSMLRGVSLFLSNTDFYLAPVHRDVSRIRVCAASRGSFGSGGSAS